MLILPGSSFISLLLDFLLIGAISFAALRLWFTFQRRRRSRLVLAFFHPYCNDGGGGERVLWKILESLQRVTSPAEIELVVYSGDQEVTGKDILDKAKERFGIELPLAPRFVFLTQRRWVESKYWPRFTMLGQSLGSMILGFEALFRLCPDIYIDTMGYAFTFPIFGWVGGCTVGAYVHYPTISNDMLERVSSGEAMYNNDASISQSALKTFLKLQYYRFFAFLYWFVGRIAVLVIGNSTWTKRHISARWNKTDVKLIYPPVDCAHLKALALDGREKLVVSIAQYRPEKNHMLQLEAFAKFLVKMGKEAEGTTLVMIGSVRKHKKGDSKRVERLLARAKELGVEDRVKVLKDVPKPEMQSHLRRATAGLHTMKDEHFGIGVVELMAAGVVPIAHNSAGPKEDIVIDWQGKKTGFLATTDEEYAECLVKVFSNPTMAKLLQKNARDSVDRFSDESFTGEILEALRDLPALRALIHSADNTENTSSSNSGERKRRNSVTGVLRPHR